MEASNAEKSQGEAWEPFKHRVFKGCLFVAKLFSLIPCLIELPKLINATSMAAQAPKQCATALGSSPVELRKKSLLLSIESWLVYSGSLYWLIKIPIKLDSIIPYKTQPTRGPFVHCSVEIFVVGMSFPGLGLGPSESRYQNVPSLNFGVIDFFFRWTQF